MMFSIHLPALQATGQADRSSAAEVAQAQTEAKAQLTQAQAQLLKAQAEMKRAEIDARRAGVEDAAAAARARFSASTAPAFVVNGGLSRRQENMMFGGFVIITVAILIILEPLVRAFSRRFDRSRQGVQIDADTAAQLQRIEQAVDAMSVEIERLSEGQRFTTKLLTKGAESESLINRS